MRGYGLQLESFETRQWEWWFGVYIGDGVLVVMVFRRGPR